MRMKDHFSAIFKVIRIPTPKTFEPAHQFHDVSMFGRLWNLGSFAVHFIGINIKTEEQA